MRDNIVDLNVLFICTICTNNNSKCPVKTKTLMKLTLHFRWFLIGCNIIRHDKIVYPVLMSVSCPKALYYFKASVTVGYIFVYHDQISLCKLGNGKPRN